MGNIQQDAIRNIKAVSNTFTEWNIDRTSYGVFRSIYNDNHYGQNGSGNDRYYRIDMNLNYGVDTNDWWFGGRQFPASYVSEGNRSDGTKGEARPQNINILKTIKWS